MFAGVSQLWKPLKKDERGEILGSSRIHTLKNMSGDGFIDYKQNFVF